jgi:hypothetical protein
LRIPLLDLATAHPRSEQAAASILGSDLPRPERLRTQLEFLERRLTSTATPELVRRVENLRRRLAAPSAPSPARLRRLADKLTASADEARFAAWERRLREATTHGLLDWLRVSEPPPWVTDDSTLDLITGILRLRRPHRTLGRDLLRARTGPGPWDGRQARPNREFLERLAESGRDPMPWLEGLPLRLRRPNGRQLILNLEPDPLEVLRMGAHFRTCLSPHQMNFFSAVSNAVDINKRVLYGRDEAGRIQGRCLLALTESGAIVTFHPYEHDQGFGFPELVAEYVQELAERMDTIVVPTGTIPTLVAPSWYDDGPTDLARQFPVLEPKDPWHRRLARIAPELLLDHLMEAFAPHGLTELTLPLALNLAPIRNRPELLDRLVPLLRGLPDLPIAAKLPAIEELLSRGELSLAQELAGPRLERHLRATHEEGSWLNQNLGLLLAERSPGRALRLVKDLRTGRDLTAEADPALLLTGARALDLLSRPTQAVALYRLALATRMLARPHQDLARQRITALGPTRSIRD